MKRTSLTFGVGRVEKEGVNLLKCLRSQSVERIVVGGIFLTRLRITSSSCVSQIMESRSTSMLHLFPWGPHLSADTIPRCWSCCKYWGVPSLVSFCRLPTRSSSFRDPVALEEVIQCLSRWRILGSGRRAKRRRGKERKGKKEGKRGCSGNATNCSRNTCFEGDGPRHSCSNRDSIAGAMSRDVEKAKN